MNNLKRFYPLEAGKHFVDSYFPNCQGALLAGSVVRGEATDTSDLDIVIFDDTILSSYRQSFIDFDWAIEVFVHNITSYKHLPRMVSEGVIIKDTGIIEKIKNEANDILRAGPEEWSLGIIEMKRYFISDVLEDFIGSTNRPEDLVIANTLMELLQEFVLRSNGSWVGSSKWVIRELQAFNQDFTNRFIHAFDDFYRNGNKFKIIKIADEILEPFGGRLFEGFRLDSK